MPAILLLLLAGLALSANANKVPDVPICTQPDFKWDYVFKINPVNKRVSDKYAILVMPKVVNIVTQELRARGINHCAMGRWEAVEACFEKTVAVNSETLQGIYGFRYNVRYDCKISGAKKYYEVIAYADTRRDGEVVDVDWWYSWHRF